MESILENFGLLFTIKTTHPYFKEGICPYLCIEPDQRTRNMFRNMHIISKYHLGEIRIKAALNRSPENSSMFSTDEILNENRHFTFLVKLTDYAFFKVTKMDFTGFPSQLYYYSNSSKGAKLSAKKYPVIDRYFNMVFEKGKTPKSVKIVAQDNTEVYKLDLSKTSAGFTYDLSSLSSGLFTVTSAFTRADQKQTQTFYYNPLARKEPVLGVVDIYTSGKNPGKDDTNTFIIPFETFE